MQNRRYCVSLESLYFFSLFLNILKNMSTHILQILFHSFLFIICLYSTIFLDLDIWLFTESKGIISTILWTEFAAEYLNFEGTLQSVIKQN